MNYRSISNSPPLLKLKKTRRKIFLKKILLYLIALLVIFAGLALISRIDRLNISEIKTAGNKVTDGDMIQASVKQTIAGNYFFVFPKSNIFYYPKNQIKQDLLDKFKALEDATFAIREQKTLEISVTEREALYTWCGEKINSEDKCYFMDKSGFLINEAPYFSGEVYFRFYGLINGAQAGNPSGSYFSPQNFDKLILFKEAIESIGLTPVALSIDASEDAEIFLSGKTQGTGPKIIFKLDSDYLSVAENLQAALSTEPLLSNFKNKYSSLSYIDLRFGNKVYYKFK